MIFIFNVLIYSFLYRHQTIIKVSSIIKLYKFNRNKSSSVIKK